MIENRGKRNSWDITETLKVNNIQRSKASQQLFGGKILKATVNQNFFQVFQQNER